MAVLTVALAAVKWILIVIGLLAALLLLLTALILFPAVRYGVSYTKGAPGDGSLNVRLSFLFKIIKIGYSQEEKEKRFDVKILLFRIRKKERKAIDLKRIDAKKIKRDKEETIKKKRVKVKKEKEKNGGNFLKGIGGAKEKISKAWNVSGRERIIRYTVQMAAEFIKALKPKAFRLRGVIGFSDPSATGYALGAVAIISAACGLKADIAGDFESERCEIELSAEGKTSFFGLLWPLVKWALKKPVRALIMPAVFGRKDSAAKNKKKTIII